VEITDELSASESRESTQKPIEHISVAAAVTEAQTQEDILFKRVHYIHEEKS
jgi:hypothetical protein